MNLVRLLSVGLGIVLLSMGSTGQTPVTLCPDIVSVNPRYLNGPMMTCTCSFFGITLDSTSCPSYIDTIPAHAHCSSSFSSVYDCHPFGTVTVTHQAYECDCQISGTPSVEVGGVKIGLGSVTARCVPDGGSTPNGTHDTAVAVECGE